MKNIPEKIYLQVDADGELPEDFKTLCEVTWCEDNIFDTDLVYYSQSAMYFQVIEQTDEEKFKMYNKLPKGKIIEMLIQCNKILDSRKITVESSSIQSLK